jgi:CMP-N,N'-diacetyllegionaminic acid synthase
MTKTQKKIPCLILARGGSKGLPKKNIKTLLNKPLIGWVIESAKQTINIGEIYVSTDSDEISEISISYGAKIIQRPKHLSTDNSIDRDAFLHGLDFIPPCEEIVHLRATTPIIDSDVLDNAIRYYYTKKDYCSSMRSGHKMAESIYKYFKKDEIYFTGIFDSEFHRLNRQDAPQTFVPNGYIDIIKVETLRNTQSLHGNKILAYVTEPVIEIDSIEDFEYLQYKMENYGKKTP